MHRATGAKAKSQNHWALAQKEKATMTTAQLNIAANIVQAQQENTEVEPAFGVPTLQGAASETSCLLAEVLGEDPMDDMLVEIIDITPPPHEVPMLLAEITRSK